MGWRYFSNLSLRIKYAAVSGAVVLLLTVGLTWAFISQTDRWLVQNLQEKGLSKVEELAVGAVPALVNVDEEGVDRLIEDTFSDAGVTYVGFLDSRGEILASRLRRQRLGEVPRIVLEKAQKAADPISISVANPDGQTVYFFVTPVIDAEGASQSRLGAAILGFSSYFIQRDIGEIVKITLPIFIGALVVSCLLFVFLIEKSLRPLQDLVRLTSKIARGDFSQRIAAHGQDELGQLTNSFNEMADALRDRDVKRKRAEEETQRRNLELQSLNELAQAVTSILDLGKVLDVLLEKIELFLPYSTATVRLFNKESGLLEPVACRNLDEKEWKVASWKAGRGPANTVFESKAPLMIRNCLNDSRVKDPEFFRKHQLVSYLGVPMIGEEELLGVLSFYTKEEREFSEDEIEFLSTLAAQAAIAIHNSQIYEEMTKLAGDLARSNRVKDEFLSVMSHELRTPLNVVMGYTEMIRDGLLGEINPEQEQALEKVIGRARDQLTMISGILQATRMEAEEVKVESQEVGLRDLLDDLRSHYQITLDKELTLIWDYPSDLPVVKTDGEKLENILENLVDNAIKFTEKGSVKILARCLPDLQMAEFQVSDTGIGIAEEYFSIIFERFRQVDSSETRRYGGVGIGLYIVKRFTELLGGKVEVESQLGKGSTFTVTIPCEIPKPALSHHAGGIEEKHPVGGGFIS